MAKNPLGQFLSVPGAKTTLPVSAAKEGFSADFADEARACFDNVHYQMGGEYALYYHPTARQSGWPEQLHAGGHVALCPVSHP